MYALNSGLTVLTAIAVMLRFRARQIKKVDLAWDDHLILLALLFTFGTGVCKFICQDPGMQAVIWDPA